MAWALEGAQTRADLSETTHDVDVLHRALAASESSPVRCPGVLHVPIDFVKAITTKDRRQKPR